MEPISKATNTGTRNKVFGAVVGAVTFAVVSFAVQQFFFKPAVIDVKLVEAASEVNKGCPVMVDKDTRLDNATALPGNIFQYNYTLVNLQKEEINLDTVKKYFEPGLINSVKINPELKPYRDKKVTIAYNYVDKNGLFVVKISVTPDMYGKE